MHGVGRAAGRIAASAALAALLSGSLAGCFLLQRVEGLASDVREDALAQPGVAAATAEGTNIELDEQVVVEIELDAGTSASGFVDFAQRYRERLEAEYPDWADYRMVVAAPHLGVQVSSQGNLDVPYGCAPAHVRELAELAVELAPVDASCDARRSSTTAQLRLEDVPVADVERTLARLDGAPVPSWAEELPVTIVDADGEIHYRP